VVFVGAQLKAKEIQMKNSKNRLFNQLSQESFLMINRKLLQIFGPDATIVLYNLIEQENGQQWFFVTDKRQTEQTGLSTYAIQKNRKILKKHQIIETKIKGIPAKLFYKIKHNIITRITKEGK